MFADYYEASIDFAGTTAINLSSAEQNLYNDIISIRKNTASLERKPDFETKGYKLIAEKHNFYLINKDNYYAFGHRDMLINNINLIPVNQQGNINQVKNELLRWKNEVDFNNPQMGEIEEFFISSLENTEKNKLLTPSELDTNNTIAKNVKADTELQATINNQLEEANELPIDVLCDDGKIQWYSFLSGINNTEKVKELLQNIQRDTKQIVSIYQNSDEYQLVHLNNDLQVIPYSDNVYPDVDAALKAIMENDNIAKLVPYEDMLQSSVTQDLTALSECDNNKYPYIKINWSDNSELTQEGYLSFDKAEDLFRNINDINQDKGTIDKTSISLFLDNQNTYNLDLNLGSESRGIAKHLNQLINESDIRSDKSLQHLQEYLKENGLLAEQEFQSEQAAQTNLFDFAEIT